MFFPPFEAFYLISLEFCTESALTSAERVADWVKRYDAGEEFPPQPALNDVQNLVNQGAAISRFFWPGKKRYATRGEELRKAFGISDDSPLKDRKLRNMVEHYDENLDEYLRNSMAGQYVPDYFGHAPNVDRGPLKLFRAFFTNTGRFEILGESFDVQPLVDAIGELHGQLIECEDNGSRFPGRLPSKTDKAEQDGAPNR